MKTIFEKMRRLLLLTLCLRTCFGNCPENSLVGCLNVCYRMDFLEEESYQKCTERCIDKCVTPKQRRALQNADQNGEDDGTLQSQCLATQVISNSETIEECCAKAEKADRSEKIAELEERILALEARPVALPVSPATGSCSGAPDGPANIVLNGEARQVVCYNHNPKDRPGQGDGWILLMKMGPGGSFHYDSSYWKEANTLNPTDLTLDTSTDAKYGSFNDVIFKEYMAVLPGLDTYFPPVSGNGKTALDFFQVRQDYLEGGSNSVLGWEHWDPLGFESHFTTNEVNGKEWYGINGGFDDNHRGTYVRWGFRFNGEADWNSPDNSGGIGSTHGSAGDNNGCAGQEVYNGDGCGGAWKAYSAYILGRGPPPPPPASRASCRGAQDGATTVTFNGEPRQVVCYTDEASGDGWVLLMKMGKTATFHYDSEYWTTSNTLNPEDVTLSKSDAKYSVFNDVVFDEYLAVLPDRTYFPAVSSNDKTALQFFQTRQDYYEGGTNSVKGWEQWNPLKFAEHFTSPEAAGKEWYGIAGGFDDNHRGTYVRWGFRWNGEANWSSPDHSGGIGSTHGSAGDNNGCGGQEKYDGDGCDGSWRAYPAYIFGRI